MVRALRPGAPDRKHGCIAQLVEQLTLNQRVVGSNPTAPTMFLVRAYQSPGCRNRHPSGLGEDHLTTANTLVESDARELRASEDSR